tara:strand:+ start:269 stop:568 length:300 start_codon:yes stop_codon:yes gene_type:complete
MSIQQIDSAPEYITQFIDGNIKQLEKIYNEGLIQDPNGILVCNCSEKDNKMDVQFMNEEMILKMISNESWESLNKSIPEDKKLIFILDIDLNIIFLIYI